MATHRTDPAKHRAQVRAANQARHRATKRLINAHQSEFDTLYAEEAGAVGVTPNPRGRINAAALERQIADLRKQLDKLTSH